MKKSPIPKRPPQGSRFIARPAFAITAAAASLFFLNTAWATPYYWDTTTTGLWSVGANWSDTANTGGITGTVPLATDTVVFNQSSVNGAETVQLGANTTIDGLTFANTGTTQLVSDAAVIRVLTLGTGGITVNSGAGAVTFPSGTSAVNISLNGNQSWTNNSSSLLSVKGAITNASTTTPVTLTFNGSGSGGTTVNSVISNNTAKTAVVVNTTGTGATTFTNANTYSGGFTMTSGTVVATVAQALGVNGGAIFLNGGTLDLETGAGSSIVLYNTTVGGDVTIKSGVFSGTVGVSHLFGNLSLGGFTLTADKGSNVTSGQRVQFKTTTLTGNATLDAENGTLLAVGAGGAAGLSGNFNLTVQSAATGTGQVSIRGTSNGTRSSGVTTFLSGINNINGTGGFAILGTTGTSIVLTGGSLDLEVTGSSILAYNTTVNGNFLLTNNTIGVTQTLGTLSIGAFTLTTASTAISGAENLAFGTTTLTGNATFSVGNGATGGTSTLTLGSVGDGSNGFGLTKSGNSALILNGVSDYSGATTVSAGTLRAGKTTGFSGSSAVTMANVSGAILDLNSLNNSIGSLAGGGATGGNVTLGSATLTTGGNNTSTSFAGVISGTGGLTKVGSGTQTFTRANTYTGATTVSAGTLNLGVANAISASSNVVLGGGTLQSNFSQTLGTLNLSASSTLDLSAGGTFAFADSSALADSWTGTLSIIGAFTDGASVKFGSSNLGLTSGQLSQITINGIAASINSEGYLSAVAVPEPSTCAAIFGALALAGAAYRRNRLKTV